MPQITYREALNQAMREEMARDPDIFLMGEDVGRYQGAFKVSQGLFEEFGERRVVDTPISELGFAGLGIGAAMAGLRPIVEMMTWNFALLAMDQIINNAAKIRSMSGGQFTAPMVLRGPQGAGHQLSSQHSQVLEMHYASIPGLVVIAAGVPRDAKGLLKSACRAKDPVIFFESERLYPVKGEVPEGEYTLPIGVADVKREGGDVTIVCWGRMVYPALEGAELLAKDGIDAEVVDLRTLRPWDRDRVAHSLAKTHRCVVVEEGWPQCGMGATVADFVQRECFDDLDAPVARVHGADVNMSYNKHHEQLILPDGPKVAEAARSVSYAE
ncbi:MAG TPA: alpha-ketoacid dehydrogenase subunit beta [Myxococcales bacterium]|nr:alpha-ketoacid dehydrogenase subunit beta [Myxococcales bacterium]